MTAAGFTPWGTRAGRSLWWTLPPVPCAAILMPWRSRSATARPSLPRPLWRGAVEIELDKETGEVRILNYAAVVDCGTPINPNLARIQVEGGLVQAMGMTLFENIQYSPEGKLRNNSFMQYKIPTRLDMGKLQVEFQSSYEPTGPFGAKSIGEIVINTPAPALVHAIANATGCWFHSLPGHQREDRHGCGPGKDRSHRRRIIHRQTKEDEIHETRGNCGSAHTFPFLPGHQQRRKSGDAGLSGSQERHPLPGNGRFYSSRLAGGTERKAGACGAGAVPAEKRVPDPRQGGSGQQEPRFVVSGEISSIYKKDGKTRKVHSLILLPGLEEAEELVPAAGGHRQHPLRRAAHSGAALPRSAGTDPWRPVRRPCSCRPHLDPSFFPVRRPFPALIPGGML